MRALLIPICCAALLVAAPGAAGAKPAAKKKPAAVKKKAMATKITVEKTTTPKKKKPPEWVKALTVSTARERPVFIAIPVAKRAYTRPDLELKREAYRSLR